MCANYRCLEVSRVVVTVLRNVISKKKWGLCVIDLVEYNTRNLNCALWSLLEVRNNYCWSFGMGVLFGHKILISMLYCVRFH